MNTNPIKTLVLAVFIATGAFMASYQPAHAAPCVATDLPTVVRDNNFIVKFVRRDTTPMIAKFYVINNTQCTFSVNRLLFSQNTTTTAPMMTNIKVFNGAKGPQFGATLPAPFAAPTYFMPFVSGSLASTTASSAAPLILTPGAVAPIEVYSYILPSAPVGPNRFAVQFYQIAGTNLTLSRAYNRIYPATLPSIVSNFMRII
jgi:hypothetical protein